MIYQLINGAMQTTAAPAPVAVSTIKTMLQIKLVVPAKIIEWGYSFDGSAAATPGKVEVIETATIFATVTAFAAADITGVDAEALLFGDPTTNYISVGTSASGYTASVEGSVAAVRNLVGTQQGAPTSQFIQQFPLGQEPFLQAGKSIRIRMTFGSSVDALCYFKLAF